MANRRMISKQIVDSDLFLDMPITSQALYFHLNVRADDDGFIGNPKKIVRMIGCSEDDLKLLMIKGFVIAFESGVIVITHWGIHNTLRKDRYTPTIYTQEKAQLTTTEGGAYVLGNQLATTRQPTGNQLATEEQPAVATGKVRLGEVRLGEVNTSCTEPSAEDIVPVVEEMADVSPIVLNDGSNYIATKQFVDKMIELYPGVNVKKEFRKMAAWCITNPTKRKTKSGITRFINNWLSKEQDRGGNSTTNKERFEGFSF